MTNIITETQTELTLQYELSNTCSCEDYDEDTDTSSPSNECFGCYQDDLDNIKHDLMNKWIDANDYELDTPIKIIGTRMTWRGVSGYKITTPEDLVSSLTGDYDFTLRFYASNDHKTLRVVRSSHDELGASFEFEQATQEELDEYEY
jgi:hypothetical protein